MEIDAEQLAAMLKTIVAETVSSTIAAMRGQTGDPWDNVDQAIVDLREADMERAKAERLAQIEAENAVIAERLRWENMPPEELRMHEEEAAHRRYAEAVANTLLMGKDPMKEDFSTLVEGLDPKRTADMVATVAAEMSAVVPIAEQLRIPGLMKMVDPSKVRAHMEKLDVDAVIATDVAFLAERKANAMSE